MPNNTKFEDRGGGFFYHGPDVPKPSDNLRPLKYMEDLHGPDWHVKFLNRLSHTTYQLLTQADNVEHVAEELQTLCELQIFLWEFVEPYYTKDLY